MITKKRDVNTGDTQRLEWLVHYGASITSRHGAYQIVVGKHTKSGWHDDYRKALDEVMGGQKQA